MILIWYAVYIYILCIKYIIHTGILVWAQLDLDLDVDPNLIGSEKSERFRPRFLGPAPSGDWGIQRSIGVPIPSPFI